MHAATKRVGWALAVLVWLALCGAVVARVRTHLAPARVLRFIDPGHPDPDYVLCNGPAFEDDATIWRVCEAGHVHEQRLVRIDAARGVATAVTSIDGTGEEPAGFAKAPNGDVALALAPLPRFLVVHASGAVQALPPAPYLDVLGMAWVDGELEVVSDAFVPHIHRAHDGAWIDRAVTMPRVEGHQVALARAYRERGAWMFVFASWVPDAGAAASFDLLVGDGSHPPQPLQTVSGRVDLAAFDGSPGNVASLHQVGPLGWRRPWLELRQARWAPLSKPPSPSAGSCLYSASFVVDGEALVTIARCDDWVRLGDRWGRLQPAARGMQAWSTLTPVVPAPGGGAWLLDDTDLRYVRLDARLHRADAPGLLERLAWEMHRASALERLALAFDAAFVPCLALVAWLLRRRGSSGAWLGWSCVLVVLLGAPWAWDALANV